MSTLRLWTIIAAVALTAPIAIAQPTGGPCCACLELSGATEPAPLQAFFCGFFPGAAKEAATERCELFNATTSDPGLLCINASAGACTGSLLEEANIACPAPAGAPAAGASALTVLVLLLAGIGAVRLRRR
jgi:hypothetical protein